MKIALVALVLRLAFAISTHGNYDVRSYEIVREIALRDGNVYAETSRYNYSPLWYYVLRSLPDPIHVSTRVLISFVDVANGLIIGAIAGARARTFYLLNPLSILIAGYGGQFEALAMLPILLALITVHRPFFVWTLATLAIVIKHDTVFIAWALFVYTFTGWRAWVAMAASAGVFVLSFVPFWAGGATGIIQNVFLYQSITGYYGLSALLPGALAIFVVMMITAPYVARRMWLDLYDTLIFCIVVQFVFMPGMSDGYWIVVLLIAALRLSRWLIAFVIIASIVTLALPWNITAELFVIHRELRLMNIVWFVCAAWLGSYFVQVKPRQIAAKPQE